MKVLFDWGLAGAHALQDQADIFIIVDVLSFSTCVDVVCSRGASVIPFPFADLEKAQTKAQEHQADLARPRKDPDARFSLSPQTLLSIGPSERLVLPSPNGSTISFSLENKTVIAGCLRNFKAVAKTVKEIADKQKVAVIAAGEKWPDGSLRPAIEDYLGAGAILSELGNAASTEAELASDSYRQNQQRLKTLIAGSHSGNELTDLGYANDVEIALDIACSETVPILKNAIFENWQG